MHGQHHIELLVELSGFASEALQGTLQGGVGPPIRDGSVVVDPRKSGSRPLFLVFQNEYSSQKNFVITLTYRTEYCESLETFRMDIVTS